MARRNADLGTANFLCNIGFIFAKMHFARCRWLLRAGTPAASQNVKDDDERVLDVQRNTHCLLVATGGSLMGEQTGRLRPEDISCMADLFGAAFAR
jgi:hypothetical protein